MVAVFKIPERLPQRAIRPRGFSDLPSPLDDLNTRRIPAEQFQPSRLSEDHETLRGAF